MDRAGATQSFAAAEFRACQPYAFSYCPEERHVAWHVYCDGVIVYFDIESHCASLQSGAANEDWFNGGERANARRSRVSNIIKLTHTQRTFDFNVQLPMNAQVHCLAHTWSEGGRAARSLLADDNERRRAGSTNIGARSLDMYNNVISK
jgi:hypothetical protein